jgi:AcrR family transcriptional regulator
VSTGVQAPARPRERARLDSDKAQRIVAAMRDSVGQRGVAGSTFDHVAREAGVSRGLLHYYFGSKERLLIEVVRRDCDIRMEVLEGSLAAAGSIDAIIEVLVAQLEDFARGEEAAAALIFEMFTASRHNEETRDEMAELYRRVRGQVAAALREREKEGVVKLRADAESVASVLLGLGDGIALQLLSDPDWDSTDTFKAGIATARFLLGDETA